MPYARTVSVASLLLLASLVYASIASAQGYSYPSTPAPSSGSSGGSATQNSVSPARTNTTNTTNTMTNTTVRSSAKGSVLGTSTTGVPNTGAGGTASETLFALVWSSLAFMGGTLLLLRRRPL